MADKRLLHRTMGRAAYNQLDREFFLAKVDELMALCDRLETRIREKSDTATRYAEAVVERVVGM